MHLVSEITKAVPFGREDSAQSNAAEIRASIGTDAVLTVEPYDAPYGPWWVIKVQAGTETRYIADDRPAVLI